MLTTEEKIEKCQEAIQAGNSELVRQYLKTIDVNAIDQRIRELLYLGVLHRQYELVEMLLSKYSEYYAIAPRDNIPLNVAITYEDVRLVELLLQHGENPHPFSLKVAITQQSYNILKKCLVYLKNVNTLDDGGCTLLNFAIARLCNLNSRDQDPKKFYPIINLLLSSPDIDTNVASNDPLIKGTPLNYLITTFIKAVNENPSKFPAELFKRTARCLDLFLLADKNLKPLVNAMIDGNYQARDKELSSICSALYFPENIQAKTPLIKSMEKTVLNKASQKDRQMAYSLL